MMHVYTLMGWGKGVAYQRRRWPDLRLSVAAQLGRVIGAPLGLFLEELAIEQGIAEAGRRTILNSGQTYRKLPRRRCSLCHKPGHNHKTCMTKRSSLLPLREMQARARRA